MKYLIKKKCKKTPHWEGIGEIPSEMVSDWSFFAVCKISQVNSYVIVLMESMSFWSVQNGGLCPTLGHWVSIGI